MRLRVTHGPSVWLAVALLAAVLLPPASASTGIPHSDLHYVYIGATVLAVLVVVACAILGARSCRCSTFSQDVIVVNYFLGCTVFGTCSS